MSIIDKIFFKNVISKAVRDDSFVPLTSISKLGFGSFNNNGIQRNDKLIDDGYGANVSVYAIINKLVTNASGLEYYLADEDGNVVDNYEISNILKTPILFQGNILNMVDSIELLMTYLLTTGNIYARDLKLDGFKDVQGLEVFPSQIIEPVTSTSYLNGATKYKVTDKQSQYYLQTDEIYHLKYINPTSYGIDSLIGLSPLQAGLYSLTGSTDVQKALSVLVKNQGVRGVLSNESNRVNDNLEKFKKSVNNTIRGIDKINQVHVTNTKVSYTPLGMSATDLKLIESGILTDRQLCNLYNVDSKLFNDPSSSTFNNMSEANKSMYQNAILPNVNKILAFINTNLVRKITGGDKYKLMVNTNSIEALQVNQKEKAEKNKLNAEGIKTVLESNTSTDGKINILINVYEFSYDDAKEIVGNIQNEN